MENTGNEFRSHGGRGGNYQNRSYHGRGRGRNSNQQNHGEGHYGCPNRSGARPRDKGWEDHMRDQSPDRQDRARPKDKQFEDHQRDPSPDRGANECDKQKVHETYNDGTQFDDRYRDDYGYKSNHGGGSNYRGQQYKDHRGQQYSSHHGQQYRDDRGQQYSNHHGQQYRDDRGQHDRTYRNNRGQQNWDHPDQHDRKPYDNYRRENSWGEKSDVHLSKALSFILRHGAEKQGYKMMSGGYLYVDDILKGQNKLRNYTQEDVERVVKNNDKQRFHMEKDEETGKWKIRANQGHSIEVEGLQLTQLQSADEVPLVVHGTYTDSWNLIQKTGLSRMGRNHIHFAAGEPGENGVISGMRKTCEIMIYIDLGKALADGFKFFRSANNVILSEGNENGIIPPKYFSKVFQRYPRKELSVDKNIVIPNVPVGGESFVAGNKKGKKSNKKKKENEHQTKKTPDGKGEESKRKRESSQVDDTALEGASAMYEESMEVDPVQEQNDNPQGIDNRGTCQGHDDTDDVAIEEEIEITVIEDEDACMSSVDFLKTQNTVAVWCDWSDEGISKIVMTTDGKSIVFNINQNPEFLENGHLAEFLNSSVEPFKVFNGLGSELSALMFKKYGVILDGTKLFDLKVAYDLMMEQVVGNLNEVKQTGYSPDLIPTSNRDDGSISEACQTYLKVYPLLSGYMKACKDYKKNLFELVNKDIEKTELKALKEKRKKESKGSKTQNQAKGSQQQNQAKGQSSKKKGK